jgi:hypothetical protein
MQVAGAAKECEADVKRLCGGVHRAADVEACMRPRLEEVSGRCRGALMRIAISFGRRL